MPLANGRYDKLTENQIQDALETELRQKFGQDIDLTESSVFSTLASVLAAVLANNQEESLQDVYRAAFLDTAVGANLDRVVSIIGIQRRDAIHATGVQRFEAGGKVTNDYTIQSGTPVQTDGDPIEFETTEPTKLDLIDSFEDGNVSEYSGSTGAATVVSDANAPEGSNALELSATSGAHIYNDDIDLQQGTTLHGFVDTNGNAIGALTFAIDPANPDSYYQVTLDASLGEVRLERVDNGTVAATLDTLTTSLVDGYHEVEIDWNVTNNIGVTIYDPSNTELGTLGGVDSTYTSGHAGFKSGGANGTKRFDWYTTSAASANIRAVLGGVDGNVGANSITRLPSPPAGVSSTTNLYPTGDTSYEDTNQETFVTGLNEETDSQLRARANEAVAEGGAATHDAIVSSLVNETEGVSSVTVYENKTDTDNTGTGGLPPHSFETVVYGGDDTDIAETIFETKAVTARDYGGANGTAVSVSVTADSNGQTRTVDFSRPTKLDIDMTLDLAIDDSYVGDDNIRDSIVQYIGGTQSDGATVIGLGVSDDVRVDAIRDRVVGDDTGVVGFDQSVDGTPISTTPSITTVNGLEVVDVGQNEVAQTDGTDASITINTREV